MLLQLKIKLKGWCPNFKRDIKVKKLSLSDSISHFEALLESRDLSDIDYESIFSAKNSLGNIYRDEIIYW
jgi:hypothetical protein